MENRINKAYFNLYPSGRDICLSCPRPLRCVYDEINPPLDECPLENGETTGTNTRSTYGARSQFGSRLRKIEDILAKYGPVLLMSVSRETDIKPDTLRSWVRNGILNAEKKTIQKNGPGHKIRIFLLSVNRAKAAARR